LDGPAPRAITVYVHGHSASEANWAFKAVPGYDLPVEMAKLGHVLLNLNLPGYSPSDLPPGLMSCVGSDADIVHQIIGLLRNPDDRYVGSGGSPIAFSRVALAGHDFGATVAEVEAYSYKDIDGLFLSGFADTGLNQAVT